MKLRFTIHVAEQATRLRMSDLPLRIDPDATHQRQVEHQGAVDRCQTRDVVSSALDAKQKPVVASELHTGDHVGGAETTHDERRCLIDHGVPDGS